MGQPVVHFEIGCRDTAKTAEFYTNLFGWSVTPDNGLFNVNTNAGQELDGHITALGHEPFNYILFYVETNDIAAAIAQAQALGGKQLVPPIPLPDGRKFAWISDPEGNTVGLLTPFPTNSAGGAK